MFDIQNRRYVGNKNSLMEWISKLMRKYCAGESFFDVFAGTGCVSKYVINDYNSFILNDFLFSNEIIYKGFFWQETYDYSKIEAFAKKYLLLDRSALESNYVSENFGYRYFSVNDAKMIGYIRQNIEDIFVTNKINAKEYSILLASLLYSMDKIANTCGHYDSYIKSNNIKDSFAFELINPLNLDNKEIKIYREDSNKLAKTIKADIAFIDPPYNSRQYSRFYHVLENITRWKQPTLTGIAMKPPEENMSDYCKVTAPLAFDDLIKSLDVQYIVVTYNNTYNSKSTSSKNKITLEQIENSLMKKGSTQVFEKEYRAFNTGKTDFKGHKEFVFITKVRCIS